MGNMKDRWLFVSSFKAWALWMSFCIENAVCWLSATESISVRTFITLMVAVTFPNSPEFLQAPKQKAKKNNPWNLW